MNNGDPAASRVASTSIATNSSGHFILPDFRCSYASRPRLPKIAECIVGCLELRQIIYHSHRHYLQGILNYDGAYSGSQGCSGAAIGRSCPAGHDRVHPSLRAAVLLTLNICGWFSPRTFMRGRGRPSHQEVTIDRVVPSCEPF